MKRLALALCLVIATAASESCARTGTTAPDDRSLDAFQPHLRRSLTPSGARDWFGPPDEEMGSGLRIYVYRLDAGRTLSLGFPGDAPITYATVQEPDGTMSDVLLR